jgi:hypothetical protein
MIIKFNFKHKKTNQKLAFCNKTETHTFFLSYIHFDIIETWGGGRFKKFKIENKNKINSKIFIFKLKTRQSLLKVCSKHKTNSELYKFKL